MYAADRCCVDTLAHALDLCDKLAPKGGLGVRFDVDPSWCDPDLDPEIDRAGPLAASSPHVCDWLVFAHDLLLDLGMMTDGALGDDAIEIRRSARRRELMRELFARRDPDEVLRVMVERYRTVV